MTKGTGEIPPKCKITEQGLASVVKLMQCPKVMEYVSCPDHCLKENYNVIYMSTGCGTTSLPVALLRKYIKVSFISVHYLLCHTALTDRLIYQNEKALAAFCKRKYLSNEREFHTQYFSPWKRAVLTLLYPCYMACKTFSPLVPDLLCDFSLLPLCNGHKERGLMNYPSIFQVAGRLISGMTQGCRH